AMKISSVLAAVLLAASALVTAGLAASSADADRHGPLPVNSPLRDLAKRADLLVGTAVDFDAFTADSGYRDRTGTRFSSITPENVMKWQLVEPTRGVLDFSAADRLVAAAQRDHQGVRGHTLLWHNQLPTWLTDGVSAGTITPAQLKGILRQHVI